VWWLYLRVCLGGYVDNIHIKLKVVPIGGHTQSMRKSRGMDMYKDGVTVEKIAKVLNHSNTTSTLRYLGITQEDVLKTYDDYEL
jgi:site-specific recombinase XerD